MSQVQVERAVNGLYYDKFGLWFGHLMEHIKEALKEAEEVIYRETPSLEEAEKIIEERVMKKLSKYQSIEYVEYHREEGAPWDCFMVGNAKVCRTDSYDSLTVAIQDGPEIEFEVYTEYVVVTEKDEERIAYFKINDVRITGVMW